MRLTVLAGPSAKARATTAPLHRWKAAVRGAGLDLKITSSAAAAETAPGVLLVVETGLRRLLGRDAGRSEELALVESAERRGTRVIWFDDADHSGRLRSYLFDHVSLYAKAQILKDRDKYRATIGSGVSHWDAFADLYDHETPSAPIDRVSVGDSDLSRLTVGWNLAYSPRIWSPAVLSRLPAWSDPLIRWFPTARPDLDLPSARRRLVSCRAGAWSDLPVVAAHRAGVLRAAHSAAAQDGFDLRHGPGLSLPAFRQELKAARVVISPFGFGEICYREYESALAGAICVKPNVDHLDTFPDLLEAGVTYLPIRWDLSDLEQVVVRALEDDSLDRVAGAFHAAYQESIGRVGRERFIQHLVDLVERAQGRSSLGQ